MIKSEDGLLLSDNPSLIALNEKEEIAFDEKNEPVSIGETLEDIQERSPVGWEQTKSSIHLCNPFMTDDFRPALAAIVVSHLAHKTMNPSSAEYQYGMTSKSAKWQILIPDYEKLGEELQDLFEFYIQSSSWINVKKLMINGQPKEIQKYRWAEKAVKFGLLLTWAAVYLVTYEIASVLFGEQLSMLSTFSFLSCSSIIALVTAFIVFVSYTSALIYLTLGKSLFKRFLPLPVYQEMIEDVDVSPRKLWNLLRRKLFPAHKGG